MPKVERESAAPPKPPYKKWKIWHRAKIAKRNGDAETLNKLAEMYAKLEVGNAG